MRDALVQLPSDWTWQPLKELADVVSGGTPSRENPNFWGGDVPWVTPTDITGTRGLRLTLTAEKITTKGLNSSSANLLPKGTILMTSRATVGESKLATTAVATNQGFKSLIPHEDVDGLYLLYQMQFLKAKYANFGTGTTFLEVNKKDTEQFQIPVPSTTKEQCTIGEVLSELDEQLELTETFMEKQRAICTGLLQDLFPEGFDVDTKPKSVLADALLCIESGKSFMCSDKPAEQGHWGVLKVSAVRPDGFDSIENKLVENLKLVNEQYEVKHGDLLITRANTPALVAAACLVDTPQSKLLLCDKTLRLRPAEGVSPTYLWLWLQTPVVRKHIDAHATGTSATMKNISQKAIKSIPIHLPDLTTQENRSEPVVAQLDLLRELKAEASKLRLQKQGLMRV